MNIKQLAIALAAAGLTAALAGASSPVLAQVGGANDRMPGGVERSPEAPGSGAASDALKPQSAPRMGTTRGLSAPKPSAPVAPAVVPPPPPAAPAPAPAPAAK